MSYSQDVVSLYHKANAQMGDSDRLEHAIKGTTDVTFNLLIFRDSATAVVAHLAMTAVTALTACLKEWQNGGVSPTMRGVGANVYSH